MGGNRKNRLVWEGMGSYVEANRSGALIVSLKSEVKEMKY